MDLNGTVFQFFIFLLARLIDTTIYYMMAPLTQFLKKVELAPFGTELFIIRLPFILTGYAYLPFLCVNVNLPSTVGERIRLVA